MEQIVMETGFTKVTLNIRDRLLKDAKHVAIDEDITFTTLVNRAIEEFIQKRKKVRK